MQPHRLTSSRGVSPSKTKTAFLMKMSGPKKELKGQRQKKDDPKHGERKHDGPRNDGPMNQNAREEKPANIDASAAPCPPFSPNPPDAEVDLDALDPAVLRSDLPDVTDQQHRAIFALVAGKGMSAAARAAGVHRGTVLRWLRDNDHFAAEYNAWHAETRDKARARLLKAVDDAVDVVINALQAQDPRTALALLSKLAILVPITPGPTTTGQVREEREIQTKMKEMMRQIEELMIRLRLP
jgi:hypothetical protein